MEIDSPKNQFKKYVLVSIFTIFLIALWFHYLFAYADYPVMDELWAYLKAMNKMNYKLAPLYSLWIKATSFGISDFDLVFHNQYVLINTLWIIALYCLFDLLNFQTPIKIFLCTIALINPLNFLLSRKLVYFTIILFIFFLSLSKSIRSERKKILFWTFAFAILGSLRGEFYLVLSVYLLCIFPVFIKHSSANERTRQRLYKIIYPIIFIFVGLLWFLILRLNPFDIYDLITRSINSTVDSYFQYKSTSDLFWFIVHKPSRFFGALKANYDEYLRLVGRSLNVSILGFNYLEVILMLLIILFSSRWKISIPSKFKFSFKYLAVACLLSALFFPLVLVRYNEDYFPYFFVLVLCLLGFILNRPMVPKATNILFISFVMLVIRPMPYFPKALNRYEIGNLAIYALTPVRTFAQFIRDLSEKTPAGNQLRVASPIYMFDEILPKKQLLYATDSAMFKYPKICDQTSPVEFDLVFMYEFHFAYRLPLYTKCVEKFQDKYDLIYSLDRGPIFFINKKRTKDIDLSQYNF